MYVTYIRLINRLVILHYGCFVKSFSLFDRIFPFTSQNSKPDSLLKMEEECKFDRTPLSSNKDKFRFTVPHKKMLGYVWYSWPCHMNISSKVVVEVSKIAFSCYVL